MANRLINETSPYLLQHAENPVDWYPWGDEAFDKAHRQDMPIFLSIGYSTCHWCHVMTRESFSDSEVAGILNQHFVSIKVDREERPDIDSVYMAVCTALTGSGGWPLTIIMTPDRKPFFAGTYFPRNGRYGRPGLLELLAKVAELWQKNRDNLIQAADDITAEMQPRPAPKGEFSQNTLDRGYRFLKETFDTEHGGFGAAPKFPTPVNLMFLLRYYRAKGEEPMALKMVEDTLASLRRGGIYDQIGFGFHRYSTDKRWLVPHFEKMLYDNALLALVYLECGQTTKKPFYGRVAEEILTYLQRDMLSPEGAFYSAQDADSEGQEGRFYTWSREQIKAVLDEPAAELFCRSYGITREGNFEEGLNIPNLLGQASGTISIAGGPKKDDEAALEEARQALLRAREQRIHPGRDEKILTGWNGLAIAAMARAAGVLGNAGLLQAADRCAAFIAANLTRSDGRLLAVYTNGKAAYPAYLDDYAFLVWGLLDLWESGFNPVHLAEAMRLTQQQIDLFWNQNEGGFFFTGSDAEALIIRERDAYDGVTPSGNSVSALNLLRLSRITGREELAEKAVALIDSFSGRAGNSPQGHLFLLAAWLLAQTPPLEVVIAGDPSQTNTRTMWETVRGMFVPEAILLSNPGRDLSSQLLSLIPGLAGKEVRNGTPLAHVCRNLSCLEPVAEPEKLRQLLQ